MVNQETVDLVKKFEGCRLTAYVDPVGIWTIGYGHTAGVTPHMTITQEVADEMLKEDLTVFAAGVKKVVNVPINDNELGALTSFAYNVGLGNLRGSTLLKKLNSGDRQGAADEFRNWTKAGGKVMNGLIRRREAERDLFLKGADMVEVFSIRKNAQFRITPNFKVSEFQCKDGSDTVYIDTDFVKNYLQKIREHFNSPVTINSAYRTPEYNKKVGGATNSYHMKGRAFDIVVKGHSPAEVAQFALKLGIKGIIQYNTFVHVDSRENNYRARNDNGKVTTVTKFL